jgi:Tfp pilus assembly protein PilN
MWHRVDVVLTDVSEERIASIFRVAGSLPLTSLTDASRADFLIFSFLPWRWRRYVPPKRRLTPLLHGATSHKTAFFILLGRWKYWKYNIQQHRILLWLSLLVARKKWQNLTKLVPLLYELRMANTILVHGRPRWARGLRHELSSLARTLDSRFESYSRHGCFCAFILCL